MPVAPLYPLMQAGEQKDPDAGRGSMQQVAQPAATMQQHAVSKHTSFMGSPFLQVSPVSACPPSRPRSSSTQDWLVSWMPAHLQKRRHVSGQKSCSKSCRTSAASAMHACAGWSVLLVMQSDVLNCLKAACALLHPLRSGRLGVTGGATGGGGGAQVNAWATGTAHDCPCWLLL